MHSTFSTYFNLNKTKCLSNASHTLMVMENLMLFKDIWEGVSNVFTMRHRLNCCCHKSWLFEKTYACDEANLWRFSGVLFSGWNTRQGFSVDFVLDTDHKPALFLCRDEYTFKGKLLVQSEESVSWGMVENPCCDILWMCLVFWFWICWWVIWAVILQRFYDYCKIL